MPASPNEKHSASADIMLLNPAMNAQQDAGQSLRGKVLIFPIRHLRSHRRTDRILDIDSHRGTGNRQLRVIGGQNGYAALAGSSRGALASLKSTPQVCRRDNAIAATAVVRSSTTKALHRSVNFAPASLSDTP